ncbi:MAG: M48 family metalloprotease [Elusimicrobia bacterium]|nr:M48 family metalloprotease [Elusimicrobiota bacterium]
MRAPLKKLVALSLTAAVTLCAPGPYAYQAFAQSMRGTIVEVPAVGAGQAGGVVGAGLAPLDPQGLGLTSFPTLDVGTLAPASPLALSLSPHSLSARTPGSFSLGAAIPRASPASIRAARVAPERPAPETGASSIGHPSATPAPDPDAPENATEPRSELSGLRRLGGALRNKASQASSALGSVFERRNKTAEPADEEETLAAEEAAAIAAAEEASETDEEIEARELAQSQKSESAPHVLFRLRKNVVVDARSVLNQHLGGQNGDRILYQDVERVLRRLLRAAGHPPEAVQFYIGNSFLPNAFTLIPNSEAEYLQQNAGMAKAMRVANVFLSVGLLRALKNEEQLAFVLAHELMHNWRGHLKDMVATGDIFQTLGHFHEFEADVEGIKLAAMAGYDPKAAAGALEALDEEYERLARQFAMFKKKKNDLGEILQKIRDVHPHKSLRAAEMKRHEAVAQELFAKANASRRWPAASQTPLWKALAAVEESRTNLERFGKTIETILAKAKSVHLALFSLERSVVAERSKAKLRIEHYAYIEEAYRALIKRAKSSRELGLLRNSVRRLADDTMKFPSKALNSEIATKQLDLTIPKQTRTTLVEYVAPGARLDKKVRIAGVLRILGSLRSRAELDAAYAALSEDSETLAVFGENSWEKPPGLGRRLWGGARRILSAELGRPALPEEIIDDLLAHMHPAWIAAFYEQFNVEILESAILGLPAGGAPDTARGRRDVERLGHRSSRFAPSELAARLQRVQETFDRFDPKSHATFEGMGKWGERHYTAGEFNAEKQTMKYESYALEGVSAPSIRDAIDMIIWFHMYTGYGPEPHLLRLLKREGKLESFIPQAYAALGERLKTDIKGVATLAERRDILNDFADKSGKLLEKLLHGVRDFKTIRETTELAWAQIEALVGAPELNAAYRESNRSHLVDKFFTVMGIALRQAVIAADMSGDRPDREELVKAARLVRRVDKLVRVYPGSALVKAHARNLADRIGSDAVYMKAYELALPASLEQKHFRIVRFLIRFMTDSAREKVEDLERLVFSWWHEFKLRWSRRFGFGPQLPGIPDKAARDLNTRDFVHFLSAVGDESLDASTKLMQVALLDRLDTEGMMGDDGEDLKDVFGRGIGLRATAAMGRWLLEDLAAGAEDAQTLRTVTRQLLRLDRLHPALLQPDIGWFHSREGRDDEAKFESIQGSYKGAFRRGAQYIRRSEVFRSVLKAEHPFRGVNVRWAHVLLEKLDRFGAWPASTAETLDLLDLLNSTGEFSDKLDERIVQVVTADPKGFLDWVAADRKRFREFQDHDMAKKVKIPWPNEQEIPVPEAHPLRAVRNPNLRAQLFGFLAASDLGEKPSWRYPWRRIAAYWRILKLLRAAKKHFSWAFLNDLRKITRQEETIGNKFLIVLEEAERAASQRAREAALRWNRGVFLPSEREFLRGHIYDSMGLAHGWRTKLTYEKEQLIDTYRKHLLTQSLDALMKLYQAYVGAQDPLWGVILENFPEPTRARDELVERLIKARSLKPGGLFFLEMQKSYRMPNPVRVAEKQLLDQAAIQMGKFTAAEKVDIILHAAGVERLSKERIKGFDRRILEGKRKSMARDFTAMRSFAQLERYLSLAHRKDRALMVLSLFYDEGENSLAKDQVQVWRLFERLVITGRDLPPFVVRLLTGYFNVLKADERARLISDIAAIDDVGPDLKGPEIVRVALRNGGVTGAKIAQVLVVHKGLIPEKYRAYLENLEEFKEKAQEMDKMKAYLLSEDRLLELIDRELSWEDPHSIEELRAISLEAVPVSEEKKGGSIGEKSAARGRLIKQVRYLLREENAQVKSIERMGMELGAGSIKIVYKVTLSDGRVWAMKLRAPGAMFKSVREFEIIDDLIKDLERTGDLDVPGIQQLVDEVKALVTAEMNFLNEAKKEHALRARIAARPWYARLIAPAPHVPKPHPLLISEDVMIEEFVPTIRFRGLATWWSPRRLWTPTKNAISKMTVREGMFDLVFDEHLEPDPHNGNRHARGGWFYRFWTTLVVMDLGQGTTQSVESLKPFMKAGVALQNDDYAGAARWLLTTVNIPPRETPESVLAALEEGLRRGKTGGLVESMMEALLEGERRSALIQARYAALQKALGIYVGDYGAYLPKDYIFAAMERAAVARVLRDRPIPLASLAWLGLRRAVLPARIVRAEMEALIDSLKTNLKESPPSSFPDRTPPVSVGEQHGPPAPALWPWDQPS